MKINFLQNTYSRQSPTKWKNFHVLVENFCVLDSWRLKILDEMLQNCQEVTCVSKQSGTKPDLGAKILATNIGNFCA